MLSLFCVYGRFADPNNLVLGLEQLSSRTRQINFRSSGLFHDLQTLPYLAQCTAAQPSATLHSFQPSNASFCHDNNLALLNHALVAHPVFADPAYLAQRAAAQLSAALQRHVPLPLLEDRYLAAAALLALRGPGGGDVASALPLLRLIASLPVDRCVL